MTRRLILMRHAQQGGAAENDHGRRLTLEGHQQAHRVGARLARIGPIPERVLSSTALRCRETWAEMAASLPDTIGLDFESGLYNASANELLDAVAAVDEATDRLLLLAHNPGMSLLALELAGSRESERAQLSRGFSPACVAIFAVTGAWSTLSPRTVRLDAFLTPGEDAARPST
jgi:phosphohistidine phosphatase